MARLAVEAARWPILKLKLGSDNDAARLGAARAARPDVHLRWTPTPALKELVEEALVIGHVRVLDALG